MKARLVASTVLALGVVIGASGCSMITPQATLIHYDPSDGVGATVGDVAVRNALIISNDGETGNMIFTVANDGDTSSSISVQYDGNTQTIDLAAGEQIVLGTGDEESQPLLLEDIGTEPGSLLPVYFSSPGSEGIEELVPVLDDRLPEYSHLAP